METAKLDQVGVKMDKPLVASDHGWSISTRSRAIVLAIRVYQHSIRHSSAA